MNNSENHRQEYFTKSLFDPKNLVFGRRKRRNKKIIKNQKP